MPRPASTSARDRAILICSLFLVSATAAAQTSRPAPVKASDNPLAIAASLEDRASERAARTGGWLDAARLQRRAAVQRGDDTSAVGAWARAAWLYAGAGKLGTARQMMVQSAEHAAAGGDVERAIAAYIDAALIAADDDREDLVPVLLHRMRLIAASPLLAQERREQLIARATTEPRLTRYSPPSPQRSAVSTPD